ncbi:dead deah box DNA helicase [Grosmannia clavigera kw1407]|uniref:Dead deah box DNA helicase n=1 Tax=Grosmannia clavigera (strain kw1407 / UAMH 11150) TaxID=655863 RepID=F0XDZ7_GROCL|nr:dead deah box DNA helicase [Grosmannia clavigera kw1407]EFX04375.1 dead deah box DNA helicase [Grosmannia clavigera kw1407]
MQSSCFSNVYGSNYNVVVSAPTGSGKTVIFELAICKLAAQKRKNDYKIVYQAPTKALCSERARDWQAKFRKIGLQVAEFTGDTSAFEARRVRTASIIITTPEKWDAVTRKWADYGILLKSVKLVLIDEVHILKDVRGATLETVISRMKSLGVEVRFVALSATIPNSNDIAQWLGLNHTSPQIPAKKFVFGDEYRPVRLEKIVHGYVLSGNDHSFDSVLDNQLPKIITRYSQKKPVLVFCFTRKSCESAALILADYWDMCSSESKPWLAKPAEICGSARLQVFLSRGVAYHHGGMERQDRASVEDAFLRGHLSIICCTSTLAVGINLPCHTVILKGTMGYHNGKLAEYDEFEIMQMIGRAGRPQFDTSAIAIILTRAETQDKYKEISSGSQAIESTLNLNLIEHLNSETVLGTISKNPSHYQIPGFNSRALNPDEQFREICKDAIDQLAQAGLIKYVDDDATTFHATDYGRAMSTFMVKLDTMRMILNMEKHVDMEKLVSTTESRLETWGICTDHKKLNTMCRATEFDEFRIKSAERPILRELNKTHDIPFKFKESITETWQKISVLIQAELSRGALPHQQRIAIEAKQASECLQRLLESYSLCKIANSDSRGLKVSLELTRSLSARAWEGHHTQLCQVPDIGPANMTKLVDKHIFTVSDFSDLTSVQIESFLSKNPTTALKISDALKCFPRLRLEGHILRHQSRSSDETPEPNAIAKVTFGHMNEMGIPRWKNKVPSVTFFAESGDGKLLHIWRGKLQEKTHPTSFLVPAKDLGNVTCHIACDEVVGTMQSEQLSCLEGTSDDLELMAVPNSVKLSEKVKLRKLPQAEGLESAPKRQKWNTTYKVSSVVVGDREFACIDLSSVEEGTTTQEIYKSPPPIMPRKCEREDNSSLMSSVLWSSSVRTTMFGDTFGDGTSLNPWTVAGSETTDDFDTDIFDDMEPPAVETSMAGVEGKSQSGLYKTGQEKFNTETGLSNAMVQKDNYVEEGPAANAKKANGPDTANTIETGGVDAPQTGSLQQLVVGQDNIVTPREGLAEKATDIQKDTSEPAWVDSSDRDVIDFLRGHVKFV